MIISDLHQNWKGEMKYRVYNSLTSGSQSANHTRNDEMRLE
jgi:hypothetical protein